MNHAKPRSGVGTPVLRVADANRRHHVAHETDRVSIEVDARLISRTDAAIIGNEAGHILVFEEMVVTFDIKLEPQAFAGKGDGYAGASPAEFGIAREVDAQVRSDLPLRLRGRDRPCGRREREKNATLNSPHRLSGSFHAARTAAVSVPLD